MRIGKEAQRLDERAPSTDHSTTKAARRMPRIRPALAERPPTVAALALLALVGLSGVVWMFAPPGPVAATPRAAAVPSAADEAVFVELINRHRTARGLRELRVEAELTAAARGWTEVMAADGVLRHAGDLSTGVTANWEVLGENVGVHSVHDLDALFQAFVQSPGHHANLIDPRFDAVGVGVVHANGKVWTTHRFMAIRGEPTTTPAPSQTPATTPPSPTAPPPPTAPPSTAPPPPTAPPSTAPPSTAPPSTAFAPTVRPSTAPPSTAPPSSPPSAAVSASGAPASAPPTSRATTAPPPRAAASPSPDGPTSETASLTDTPALATPVPPPAPSPPDARSPSTNTATLPDGGPANRTEPARGATGQGEVGTPASRSSLDLQLLEAVLVELGRSGL